MTTPQIVAAVIIALAILAVIVVVIVAWSANSDWNAKGYQMDIDEDMKKEEFTDLKIATDGAIARSDEIGEEGWFNADELQAITNGTMSRADAEFIAAMTPVVAYSLLTQVTSPQLAEAIEKANARMAGYPEFKRSVIKALDLPDETVFDDSYLLGIIKNLVGVEYAGNGIKPARTLAGMTDADFDEVHGNG